MIRLKLGMDPKNIKIDKENRQLLGVIAVEQIDIKDWRPFSVNESFISDLVAFAAKQKEGVKSHFGHNYNNLGKQLGRATNWRIEDGKAKFDLTIAKYADSSPGLPNLGKYVMEVLEEDNAACMCSIVFKEKYYYQLDKSGAEIKVYYYNKDGAWVRPIQEYGKVYPKFEILKSVDIVEEGAATNSMFELEDIDQNDQGAMNSFFSFFKNLFTNQKMQEMANEHTPATPETPATTPAAPVTLEALKQQLTQQLATLTETVSKLAPQAPPAATPPAAPATPETPPASADATQLAALQQQIQELKTKLANTPAAPELTPDSGAGGGAATASNLWELDPINKEAMQRFSHLVKDNKDGK